MTEQESNILNEFTESMVTVSEALGVAAETATGFRRKLEEAGWSKEMAEMMAGRILVDLTELVMNGGKRGGA